MATKKRTVKISDFFNNPFKKVKNSFNSGTLGSGLRVYGELHEPKLDFANCIFLNCCDILTDLINDTTIINTKGDNVLFSQFKFFFENSGKLLLNKLFIDGFVVVGVSPLGFQILTPDEYSIIRTGKTIKINPINSNLEAKIVKSQTFEQFEVSDRQILLPFLNLLNNILNGTNTVSARMGALIAATPVQPTQNPATELLEPEQREQIENEVSKNYGSLAHQKQFLLFNRPLNLTKISLSETDRFALEKARFAILAIADRIKVPANQIAIVDAASGKTLSNGGELREGDFMKYQSFERLLNQIFVNFAKIMGLTIDYLIYNKPTRKIT